MKTMDFEIGERVQHPARPDWGPGEVLAASGDGKVTIYFAMVGQKTLTGALKRLTGPEASHSLLDHRIRTQSRGAKTRAIADLKAAFLSLFPGGSPTPTISPLNGTTRSTRRISWRGAWIPPHSTGLSRAESIRKLVSGRSRS